MRRAPGLTEMAAMVRAALGGQCSWVLFERGTVVVLTAPEGDLVAQATEILRREGPVRPGTRAGDFGVVPLPDGTGWVVTFHYPGLCTFVARSELKDDVPDDLRIGLHGRAKRDRDAHSLRAIHVEGDGSWSS